MKEKWEELLKTVCTLAKESSYNDAPNEIDQMLDVLLEMIDYPIIAGKHKIEFLFKETDCDYYSSKFEYEFKYEGGILKVFLV